MALSDKQDELCRTNPSDHSNLRAVYINCTLGWTEAPRA